MTDEREEKSMAFSATVLRVFIASPSDVSRERDEIEQAIFKWNTQYAKHMQVVLLPERWENVAPSYSGANPQQILNEKLVNDCDILIGVFWSKLGSPTATHISGTIEEIELCISRNKEIMLYFVNKDYSYDSDLSQLPQLQQFKKDYESKGLHYSYDVDKIVQHLYTKVMDYKEKNNEVKSLPQEIRAISAQTSSEKDDFLSIGNMIDSFVFTDAELLLLKFIVDSEQRYLGSRWQADSTITEIVQWETSIGLLPTLSENYHKALNNLVDRQLLEVSETTSHGNPRLYVMPVHYFNELRKLPSEAQSTIKASELKYMNMV